jgi:hypothetical protein
MQITTFHVFAMMTLPLAVIAVVVLVSPRLFGRLMTGRPVQKARWKFTFVRVAAVLVLIGAVWTWLEWLRSR